MTLAHRDAWLCCLCIQVLRELHGVTFYQFCGLSWPPPSAASTKRDPTVRDLFSVTFAICCWLTVSMGEV